MGYSYMFVIVLLFATSGALDNIQKNRFLIFPGFDVIKMDKCRSDVFASYEHCNLYGVFIEKMSLNTTKKVPKNISSGLYNKLYNQSNNYFPLMNYISISNNPALKRENMLDIVELDFISEKVKTLTLMRAIRFVQWSINIPIIKVFEEIVAGIDNNQNKNGLFIFLLKFFKISNSDVLFYCKFESSDNCTEMYDGINFKLATNNIIYGNCNLQDKQLSKIKLGKHFIYFCNNNNLSTIVDAINEFVNRTIINNGTDFKFLNALNAYEIINNKSSEVKSKYRITTYRLMGEMFGKEIRHNNTDLKPMWDQAISYLEFLRQIINEYDINLIDIVFNHQEQEYSLDLQTINGSVISKTHYYSNNLENLIENLCLHDKSTCDLHDPYMNVNIDTKFIHQIPVRLEYDAFEENLDILLSFHDVNVTNLVYKKIIYDENKYMKSSKNRYFTLSSFDFTKIETSIFTKQEILSLICAVSIGFIIGMLFCSILRCLCCKKIKHKPSSKNTHCSFVDPDLDEKITINGFESDPLLKKSNDATLKSVQSESNLSTQDIDGHYAKIAPNRPQKQNSNSYLSLKKPVPPPHNVSDNPNGSPEYIEMFNIIPHKPSRTLPNTSTFKKEDSMKNLDELNKLLEDLDQTKLKYPSPISLRREHIENTPPKLASPALVRRGILDSKTWTPVTSSYNKQETSAINKSSKPQHPLAISYNKRETSTLSQRHSSDFNANQTTHNLPAQPLTHTYMKKASSLTTPPSAKRHSILLDNNSDYLFELGNNTTIIHPHTN